MWPRPSRPRPPHRHRERLDERREEHNMVMWEIPAGPAGANGGCAGRVMYDGRHEPEDYEPQAHG